MFSLHASCPLKPVGWSMQQLPTKNYVIVKLLKNLHLNLKSNKLCQDVLVVLQMSMVGILFSLRLV